MSIILLDIGNVVVSVDFMRFCRAVALDPVAGVEEIFRKYCTSASKAGIRSILFDNWEDTLALL
jgi:glucose-1-phosphatase